jgi:hypothetical protein
MITLKEMLAEPQTMYDGGMVQHMAEGGEPVDLDKIRKERIDKQKYTEFMDSIADESMVKSKLYNPEDWKYNIGDKVRTEQGVKTDSEPWKITKKWVKEEGLLEESNPREGKFIKGPNVPYYEVTRGEMGQEEVHSIPEWAIKQKFGIQKGPIETEPQLPVTTKPPVPRSLEKKLPKIVRTLVKAGRGLSPVGIALNILQFIPQETKAAAIDYLKNTPTHELFGLKQSGQEYVGDLWEEVKDYLTTETEPTNTISVFPKPQKMFPEKNRPAGGEYLNPKTQEKLTNKNMSTGNISITPEGKPSFQVNPLEKEIVGSPDIKGATQIKTNLFKKKAGWKWIQSPKGYEDTTTLVSVENKGKHYYTLSADFPNGVNLTRYPKEKSEPRLRPTIKGIVELGKKVGEINVRGKKHTVYDKISNYYKGGQVRPMYDGGIVPSSTKPMYDGGLV